MQVGRGQVDDDFLARNPESFGLQGRYGSQQALPYGRIREADEVDADAQRDVHLHRHRNRFDPDAFCSMYIDQHVRFCPKLRKSVQAEGKKQKNVVKFFLTIAHQNAQKRGWRRLQGRNENYFR